MKSWPIFDEDILGDLNHRSAEVHLEAGLHMTAIALLAGILSSPGVALPEEIKGGSLVASILLVIMITIICLSVMFVLHASGREYAEMTATVPTERPPKASTPWITRLLCVMAAIFILISEQQMGSSLLIFMTMTGIGLGVLSVSEFLTSRPGTLRISLVMVLAGAVTAVLMSLVFPKGETLFGLLVYLIMSAIVVLECRLERARVSWIGGHTAKDERVMRIILFFSMLVMWRFIASAESSRYD